MQRKLRMGMVGGGQGAFIGAVHRIAANLDGEIELVCGAFSSTAERSIESGKSLYLPESRCYENYQTMFEAEAKLPESERMDFVAIVTPNHMHFPVAKLALESGFHVISDKPATYTLAEALELKTIVEQTGLLYGLTHTYNGYPLVKHAKSLIENGDLGKVTKVVVEYSQGWLAGQEDTSNKQASWRLDPKRSGISNCMGDIGVHAANLAEYMTGAEITQLCAELDTVVDGRLLDDDGTVMLRFNSGAKGVLMASQISVGEENNLNIRVYGDKASIQWSQQEPNNLWLKFNGQPSQLIRPGVGELSATAMGAIRTPAGHPEGYLEAFANIYMNFVAQLRDVLTQQNSKTDYDVPSVREAVRGMAFITNTVAASKLEQKWHEFSLDASHLEQIINGAK